MKKPFAIIIAPLLLGWLIFAGCSDSSNDSAGSSGEIRMYLTDSPNQVYEQVNVVIERVEVHQAGGEEETGWIEVDSYPGTYDLLELSNGLDTLLVDDQLPVGHYTQIRLYLGEGSTVVVEGVTYPLEIPSGTQSGIKLNHPFDIEADVLYELTLDFDASSSINQNGNGDYIMNPVIRVVANEISGSISGTISPPAAEPEIYTLVGADTARSFADPATGYFKIVALPEGTYDLTINPVDGWLDTTIGGIEVIAQQDTDLGSITLTPAP